MHENTKLKYFAHLATITETEGLEYPNGTRCIVLAADDKDNFKSVGFVTVNDDGMIERIQLSTDSRYKFRLDEPERTDTIPDDLKLPNSVSEAIISRAKYYNLIDWDDEQEKILKNINDEGCYKAVAEGMLSDLKELRVPDIEEAIKNSVGYLFAKAMEKSFNDEQMAQDDKMEILTNYSPSEAFNGGITSSLPENLHEKLVEAMDLGKQFYSDIKIYLSINGMEDSSFDDTYIEAATLVQQIGHLSYKEFFADGKE